MSLRSAGQRSKAGTPIPPVVAPPSTPTDSRAGSPQPPISMPIVEEHHMEHMAEDEAPIKWPPQQQETTMPAEVKKTDVEEGASVIERSLTPLSKPSSRVSEAAEQLKDTSKPSSVMSRASSASKDRATTSATAGKTPETVCKLYSHMV